MPHPRPDTSIVKKCSRCKETLPRGMFGPSKTTFDFLRAYCRPCISVIQKERRTAFPKTEEQRLVAAEYARKWRENFPRLAKDIALKTKYGIEHGTYDKMIAEQNGKCAICQTDKPGGKGDFAVDHCHDTNIVRALLCIRCNIGIGQFLHNKNLLLAAIDYLSRTSQ